MDGADLRFGFLNNYVAAIEATFAANTVVDVPCAAVGANSDSGHFGYVMGATFGGTGL